MNEEIFINGLHYFILTSVATIVLAIILDFIARLLTNRFNKKHQDKITTNKYLYNTIRVLIWIVVLIIIMKQIKPLNNLGNTLLGATSIIAVAVGIAAQATFGNYIAGFFLAIHQPFKVGDVVRIKEKGLSGTVKDITFRHTVLLTQEKTEIIIPNTIMNSAIVEDMSNGIYSDMIELKISNDTDLNQLEEIIKEILNEEELVLKDNPVKLIIRSLEANVINVAFPIHTRSLSDFSSVRNSILPKLVKAFKANNIHLTNSYNIYKQI